MISTPSGPVDFTLQDYRGHSFALSQDAADSGIVVLAFLGTECPLAKLYAARLQTIADDYAARGVRVIGVNSNVQDSVTEMEAFVRRQALTFPFLKDLRNELADELGVTRTPEVVVLDASRRIQYRGRVDDQYLVGVIRDQPTRADLREALDELLTGKSVSIRQTQPLGCLIGRVRTANPESPVTYTGHIAAIFRDHCVSCHRPGEIAPFSLTSHAESAGWGEMIAEVVRERRMPPWHADPTVGKFANDCSLSIEQQELIAEWVRNGCPEGDSKSVPTLPEYVDGWQLTQAPDEIIAMRDKPFAVPADVGEEGVKYQNFWVDPKFTDDRWIIGAEVRPGNTAVVHHIIVYVHPEGRKGKSSSFITAYVPGLRLDAAFPDGAAKRIPKGSWLRFQVHYTPIGAPQLDLSQVGFVYADPQKISHEVRTIEVAETGFEIPPMASHHEVRARSAKSAADVTLLSFSPHMHLRGKSFEYELEQPDGQRERLLNVPRYDFNWQTRYTLAEPLHVPAGSRMHCRAVFDNSERNLANPNPRVAVRWGDQSWDEMMIGYMDVMFPVASPGAESTRLFGRPKLTEGVDINEAIQYLDKNGDGVLSREEVKPIPILDKGFDRIDVNGDGVVTRDELDAALKKYGLPQ